MSRSRRFLSLDSRPRRQFTDRKTPPGTASSLGDARRSIALEHGFRWECLTPKFDPNASFIELIIEVGGGAEPEIEMKTHPGKEFGVVLKGRLGIAVAFDTYILNPRDSISFNSDIPHSMWNAGHEPMHAIWFEFGRIPQT
jgi:quercetin dioxygenase-like cupin family protein